MKKTHLFYALIIVFAAALGASCMSSSTDGFYIDQEDLKATHTVQQSPCPQEVGSVKIYDTRNASDALPIDSVVARASHPSIDVTFDGGSESSASFGNESELNASVWFNCNEAKSVDTSVEFDLYRDGELIETAVVSVKVTVK